MPYADDQARAAFFLAGVSALVLYFFRRPSKDFSWSELTTTETGLENQPGLEERLRIILLARQVLQPLRDRFGALQVNSGFRSVQTNTAVGGVSSSYHLAGSAADIQSLEGVSSEQMASWLWGQIEMPLDEVIIEPSWLHVARGSAGAPGKRRFLASDSGGNLSSWEPSLPMVVS